MLLSLEGGICSTSFFVRSFCKLVKDDDERNRVIIVVVVKNSGGVY
jgi:hypothetical protein